MKTNFALITLIVLIMALTGCATAGTPSSRDNIDIAVAPLAPAATMAPYGGKTASNAVVAEAVPAQPRLVIKNADLTLVVEDPAGSMTTLMTMANEMGGYVVSSKSFKTRAENGTEVPQATLSLRIPAEKLDAALAQAKKLVKDPTQDVRNENVSGQDVTADYVDQKSRLGNLENTEKALQRMQETATKTSDVLDIFDKLTAVRQQIEQIKGQLKYYEEAAALSAMNIQLLAKAGIAPLSIGGWEPVGVVRDAFQTLIDIGKTLVEVLIWLVIVFLPVGAILFFPGRFLWRWLRKAFAAKPGSAVPYGNLQMPLYPPQAPMAPPPAATQPPQQPGQPPQQNGL